MTQPQLANAANLVSGVYETDTGWQRARVGHMESAIFAGADINAKNALGRTPLMYAAAHASKAAVVLYLVEQGATIDACSMAGWQPLHFLAASNQEKDVLAIAEILLSAGADPLAPTSLSIIDTPLAMAQRLNPRLKKMMENWEPESQRVQAAALEQPPLKSTKPPAAEPSGAPPAPWSA